MSKFCSKCGAEAPDDAKFCLKCGNPFAESQDEGKPTEVKKPLEEAAPAGPVVEPTSNISEKPKKKKKGCLVAVLIAVAVVVLIVILMSCGSSGSADSALIEEAKSVVFEELDPNRSIGTVLESNMTDTKWEAGRDEENKISFVYFSGTDSENKKWKITFQNKDGDDYWEGVNLIYDGKNYSPYTQTEEFNAFFEDLYSNKDVEKSAETVNQKAETEAPSQKATAASTETAKESNDLSDLIGVPGNQVQAFLDRNGFSFNTNTELGAVYSNTVETASITVNEVTELMSFYTETDQYPAFGIRVGDKVSDDLINWLSKSGFELDEEGSGNEWRTYYDENGQCIYFGVEYMNDDPFISYLGYSMFSDTADYDATSSPAFIYLSIPGILPNAENYIKNNPFLFTTDKSTASQYTDFNKDPRAFFKSYNENEYGNALIRMKGCISEAKEYAVDGGTMTELDVYALDGNTSYKVFVNASCNVYSGDCINVLGLPVCMIDNGYSQRLGIAAAYLGKYNDALDAYND